MTADGSAFIYQTRALRVANNIKDGNLTTAIDLLFDDEDPVAVVFVALHLVEVLTLDGAKAVTEVTGQLNRLIDRWSDDQ